MDLTTEFQNSYQRIESNNTIAGIIIVGSNGSYLNNNNNNNILNKCLNISHRGLYPIQHTTLRDWQ
jgi:hypothetical protein